MNLRKIFLYNVLPKKRMLLAFIGFLISSTILSGAGILMSSIVNSTATYLGENESILVISNPEASTPYTSVIPLDLADTISSIEGVKKVSPEVMTAAVYKDKAVYFRGVDASSFWHFTDVEYLEGQLLTVNDTFEVSVGINFAERNNLNIGDYITLFSTRSEAAIELKIKSIFGTNTLLDDEIISSLWIGQFFAFEDFNYITHLRIEIDLDIIDNKEMIRELVSKEFEFIVHITSPGNLQELNASVSVYNKRGELINETIILNDNQVSFVMPFGEYEIQCVVKDVISESIKILLDQDKEVEVFIQYIERNVYFRVITDENEPIQGAVITLYRQDGVTSEENNYVSTTDSNGEANISVSDGGYYGRITYEIYRKDITFTTSISNDFEIILISRHPQIIVENPINNSVIIGQNIDIRMSSSPGYSIYFYWDDNLTTMEDFYLASPGEEAPESISIPFDEGAHSLTIETYNQDFISSGYNKSLNYAETKVYFNVIEAIPEDYYFTNTMNGSHLNPSTVIILNTTHRFSGNFIYKWNNDPWLEVISNIVSVPYVNGIHTLTLKAELENSSKEWDFVFAVTDNPEGIGIIGLKEHMKVRAESEIQTWFNPQYEAYYNWNSDADLLISQNGIIKPEGLAAGNHTLYLAFYDTSTWSNRSYTFWIDNSAPIIAVSYINGSEINYESVLTVSTNEILSSLEFSWDSLSFSTAYDTKILVPQKNGNHTLTLRMIDLAGNYIELYYEFVVVNFTGGAPIDFYILNEYSGTINQKYIDLEVFSNTTGVIIEYQITGSVFKAGSVEDFARVFLYPGSYNLKIIFWVDLFDSRERTWTFEILDGQKTSIITNNDLNETYTGDIIVDLTYFDINYTINSINSLYISDGYYSLFYQLVDISNDTFSHNFIVDTIEPYVAVLSPHKAEEGLDPDLILESDAVQILVIIDDKPIFEYDGFYDPPFLVGGEHTIIFYLTDSYYNTKTESYTFYLEQEYVPVNLTLEVKIRAVIYQIFNLSVAINDFYNSPTNYFTTDINGGVFFNVFEGEFRVKFNYADKHYDFQLDTKTGINQNILIGYGDTIVEVRDYFANSSISNQYCIIRDLFGRRIMSQTTNNQGQFFTSSLPSGDYICYFTRGGDTTIAIPFEIYGLNNIVLFEIPSKRKTIVFEFKYDNGSKVYNLPVIVETELQGQIITTTSLYSKFQLYLSYGYVNLTIFLKDGSSLHLRRIFEPGKELITIVLPSDSEEQWRKIPFKPVAGFSFLIAFSTEYLNYYLKGSLLFIYTLAYAEIVLILVVVIVNMYSILQNMYKESKRETTIIKMIGGTNLRTIVSIFSRLGLIAFVASIIGYGIGTLILKILSSLNQTVFFGHTFVPKGSWNIFLLNVVLILLVAILTTIMIARKASKERKVSSVRR